MSDAQAGCPLEFDTSPATRKASFLPRQFACAMHSSFASARSIGFAGATPSPSQREESWTRQQSCVLGALCPCLVSLVGSLRLVFDTATVSRKAPLICSKYGGWKEKIYGNIIKSRICKSPRVPLSTIEFFIIPMLCASCRNTHQNFFISCLRNMVFRKNS